MSFFLPDYTAYNEMLSLFRNFVSIPVPLSADTDYQLDPETISQEIARGASIILTSNPRNPTGRVVKNPELAEIQTLCRGRATLVADEFYSGYNYTSDCDGSTISAASNVDDVDKDDVIILDGLTKRFRLPGWRLAWVLGPKEYVKARGAAHCLQDAAIPMLEPGLVRREMACLQKHFKEKRDYVVSRLTEAGFKFKYVPDSAFYIWLNLENLPEPIRDGLSFFEACLEEKVIVVPGIFFDLNPSHRRDLFDSPCHHFVRLSYGPKMEQLRKGCDGIERPGPTTAVRSASTGLARLRKAEPPDPQITEQEHPNLELDSKQLKSLNPFSSAHSLQNGDPIRYQCWHPHSSPYLIHHIKQKFQLQLQPQHAQRPARHFPARSVASSTITTPEDPYAFLGSFDTVFVIDDSGSMRGRSWRERRHRHLLLNHKSRAGADTAAGKGPGGYRGFKNTSAVEALFESIQPFGGTPTGTRLQSILKPYLQLLEANKDDLESCKPVNVIVITDGVPSDDVEGVLLNAARKLDRIDAPSYQIGVQFFQVGNEPGARDALKELDDGLSQMVDGGVRDIVDTVTWDGYDGRSPQALTGESILKVVLGAVVRRLDRR
ncbi:unnamed protein product [Parascedosporium putredinis]|uniref:Aminotransferase class I/classII large domain-containing protein n=1 Tax=Parascedosporium putredinis TaxID=1442378 RepID=A0A9P1M5Z9_9PEZI|nr:unnamed protein product [Parascedosporium putredinis]CAI7988737.1 unnamed protein product [Parascedosporium putredinis]